jgi:hypothetical protein
MLKRVLAAMGMAIAPFAPAQAEPQEVPIEAEADWEHEWTAMRFPASFDGFTRSSIYEFQSRQSDMSANYEDAAGNSLSIYVFRPGIADASIWHDRALVALGASDEMFGEEEAKGAVQGKRSASFAPVGSDIDSGLLTVFASKGPFRSVGVALFASGDWLVKMRLSSRGLDPEGLEDLLRQTLGQLPEMAQHSATSAYLVEACLAEVNYPSAPRLMADGSDDDAIMSSLTDGRMMTRFNGTSDLDGNRFCRVGEGGLEGTIYRPQKSEDRYIIALGDSGTSVHAAPQVDLDEMLAQQGDIPVRSANFQVTYATATDLHHFMPFRTLPSPNQAARAVFAEKPITSVIRPLSESTVTVAD